MPHELDGLDEVIATDIVRSILNDLTERRGFRQSWTAQGAADEIDEDIQNELCAAWRARVLNQLGEKGARMRELERVNEVMRKRCHNQRRELKRLNNAPKRQDIAAMKLRRALEGIGDQYRIELAVVADRMRSLEAENAGLRARLGI